MLLVFVVGDILGGGIYALVGDVGGRVGGAIWAAFAGALLLAAFTAASYAELTTKYPSAGGAALFVERAFSRRLLSFLVTFAVAASGVTSAATLARAFGGDYLAEFIEVETLVGAAVLLLAVGLVNFAGITASIRLNLGLTAVELAGLLMIAVIGVGVLLDGGGDPARATEFETEGSESSALAILAGTALAFYALIGFEDSANVAEEVRDPRRSYPLALFGGLAIAGVVYLSVTVIASMVVPTDELARSSGPLLEVNQGPLAVDDKVFSAIGLLALANGALINLIMASRLLYGMSREGLLPPALSRVHPRTQTPSAAIAFVTALALLLCATGGLETLADTTVLLLLAVFIAVNLSTLALRRDQVARDHFRAPRAVPVLGALACALVMTQPSGEIYLRAGLLLLLGTGLSLIAARRRSLTQGKTEG